MSESVLSIKDRNKYLLETFKGIIDLNDKDSFFKNRKKVVEYLNDNIDVFIQMLSVQTKNYLAIIAKDKKKEFRLPKEYMLNEDMLFLFKAGMLNPDTDLRPYKDVLVLVKKMVKCRKSFNMTKRFSIAKGMIDLYGYIELDKGLDIYNQYFKKPINKEKFIDILNESLLIRQYCVVTKDYVCRKEINRVLNQFLEMRQSFDNEFSLEYKSFDDLELVTFANTFDLDGTMPGVLQENYDIVFNKMMSVELLPNLNSLFTNDKDRIDSMSYNAQYPKWVLRGHCIDELSQSDRAIIDYDLSNVVVA